MESHPFWPRLRAQALPIMGATTLTLLAGFFATGIAKAAGDDGSGPMPGGGHMMLAPPPVGVAGAHMPPAGSTIALFSSRMIHLHGVKAGASDVSPEWVVLNAPNPNRPPVHYRRVPLESTINMQVLGLAHGVTPWLSVSAGTTYLNKSTRVLTFQGGAGTTRLGTRTDETEGLGDSQVAVTLRLWHAPGHVLHAGLGLGLPTGSIKERIRPLMPNGLTGNARAGYSLQLGTGTFDVLPALTWVSQHGPLGFGAGYRGRIALEDENDEGYRWGDLHMVTAWASYDFTRHLTGSARIEASTQAAIRGRDLAITGAGVGANPLNTGGERIEAFLGLNARGPIPGLGVGRIGAEIGVPLYEYANNVHLARDWSAQLTAAVRF